MTIYRGGGGLFLSPCFSLVRGRSVTPPTGVQCPSIPVESAGSPTFARSALVTLNLQDIEPVAVFGVRQIQPTSSQFKAVMVIDLTQVCCRRINISCLGCTLNDKYVLITKFISGMIKTMKYEVYICALDGNGCSGTIFFYQSLCQ